MRISDWSSDVCSSDLAAGQGDGKIAFSNAGSIGAVDKAGAVTDTVGVLLNGSSAEADNTLAAGNAGLITGGFSATGFGGTVSLDNSGTIHNGLRSEEHTSELQSLMRISYAVFCLNKKTNNNKRQTR